MPDFVSGAYRPKEDPRNQPQKPIAQVRLRPKHWRRYAQSAEQLADGPGLINRLVPNSIEFGPSADRYNCDETGQYRLDLPPVV